MAILLILAERYWSGPAVCLPENRKSGEATKTQRPWQNVDPRVIE